MPLIQRDEGLVLLCINRDLPSHASEAKDMPHGSTMGATSVYGLREITRTKPGTVVETDKLAPLVAYVCACCGYTELYSGAIVDPDRWR